MGLGRKVLRVQPQAPKPFKQSLEDQKSKEPFLNGPLISKAEDTSDEEQDKRLVETIQQIEAHEHRKRAISQLVHTLPQQRSQKLLEEASKSLTMQLNNMAEIKTDLLKSHKFRVVPSPSFVLDRSYRHEQQKPFSTVAEKNIITFPDLRLPKISEESEVPLLKAKAIEDQKYLYTSKFLGGSAIFPKYSASERSKSIIEPDRAVAEYKLRFRERLASNWAETV